MTTPVNKNNIAYARHYKAVNVIKDTMAYEGVELANKGSIDLPSHNGTNVAEGFFTQHTTASIASQAGLIVENYYACLPFSLAGRINDDEE